MNPVHARPHTSARPSPSMSGKRIVSGNDRACSTRRRRSTPGPRTACRSRSRVESAHVIPATPAPAGIRLPVAVHVRRTGSSRSTRGRSTLPRRSTQGPRTDAPKPVPVESAHVIPEAERPQTSAIPSPFTSANWTVDAYAAGCHPLASLQAGPENGAPNAASGLGKRAGDPGRIAPAGVRKPVAVHVGAARTLRPWPAEELVDRADHASRR